MDREQIRVSKFENRENNLEVVDGAPKYSSTADFKAARRIFLRALDIKSTDSHNKRTEKIFSSENEVIYQKVGNKDLFHVTHDGRTLFAFEGISGNNSAQELVERFFSDLAERQL